MQSRSLDAYSPAQIQTLELLSTQVAIAIKNSQLYQQARQELAERRHAEEALRLSEQAAHLAADQLRMVNQIGLKITAGLDFDQLLQTIYEQCRQIGDTDIFYLALYDDATGHITVPLLPTMGSAPACRRAA